MSRHIPLLISGLLIVLILIFQPISAPSGNPPSPSPTPTSHPTVLGEVSPNEYLVTRVIDGDTIEVTRDNQVQKVRLIGVNSPESVDPRRPIECFGKQASDYLKNLLLNQPVTLQADPSQDNLDRYGRLLRYVFHNNQLINQHIIEQGYAYEYTYDLPYQFQQAFKQAQQQAQSGQRGLWDPQACPDSLPSPTPTINPSCAIKGNISSSGEKIYHLPNCRDYNRTSINQSTGEQWFCTEQQAIDAGWRKAANC